MAKSSMISIVDSVVLNQSHAFTESWASGDESLVY